MRFIYNRFLHLRNWIKLYESKGIRAKRVFWKKTKMYIFVYASLSMSSVRLAPTKS